MTCALSLVLWMAASQTAEMPAPAAAAVVLQCPPCDAERALRAQLDDARAQLDGARAQLDQTRAQLDGARRKLAETKAQLAKAREESGMADHAVAALLASDRPDLAPLERVSWRNTSGGGRWRIRDAQVDVYVSPHTGETMTAVVLTLRNPREAPAWEPKEAFISAPAYRRDPPVPVALRSSPERIRPGETARIALVFDRSDVRLDEPYAILSLLRDGKWEMELELQPRDFPVASATSGGAR